MRTEFHISTGLLPAGTVPAAAIDPSGTVSSAAIDPSGIVPAATIDPPAGTGPTARHGDVLVGIRLSSSYLPIMRAMGDPWTHVALAIETPAGLVTAEAGPSGCFSRSFAEFTARYDVVGVLRPALCPTCLDVVAATAWDHVAHPRLTYSMPLCVANAAGPLLRRALPRRLEGLALRAAMRLSRRAHRLDPQATACGPFIAGCFEQACDACRFGTTWPVRERVGLLDRGPAVTDLRRERTARRPQRDRAALLGLMTPSDIWCVVPASQRSIWWTTEHPGWWQHGTFDEPPTDGHPAAVAIDQSRGGDREPEPQPQPQPEPGSLIEPSAA